MKQAFEYPILLIRENDSNLHGMNSGFGLVSQGGESFYKKAIKIIDSQGRIFKIKSVYGSKNARLIDSILHFQPMRQMSFEIELCDHVDLDKIKVDILNHIKAKPKRWLTLGTIEMIEEWVNEKNNIPDLIKMFR